MSGGRSWTSSPVGPQVMLRRTPSAAAPNYHQHARLGVALGIETETETETDKRQADRDFIYGRCVPLHRHAHRERVRFSHIRWRPFTLPARHRAEL